MTSECRTLALQEVYKYDKLCLKWDHEVSIPSEGDAYCQDGTKSLAGSLFPGLIMWIYATITLKAYLYKCNCI